MVPQIKDRDELEPSDLNNNDMTKALALLLKEKYNARDYHHRRVCTYNCSRRDLALSLKPGHRVRCAIQIVQRDLSSACLLRPARTWSTFVDGATTKKLL